MLNWASGMTLPQAKLVNQNSVYNFVYNMYMNLPLFCKKIYHYFYHIICVLTDWNASVYFMHLFPGFLYTCNYGLTVLECIFFKLPISAFSKLFKVLSFALFFFHCFWNLNIYNYVLFIIILPREFFCEVFFLVQSSPQLLIKFCLCFRHCLCLS